jgi:hypothetical protein
VRAAVCSGVSLARVGVIGKAADYELIPAHGYHNLNGRFCGVMALDVESRLLGKRIAAVIIIGKSFLPGRI